MHLNKVTERFEAKFIPVTESGCWLWTGAVWMSDRYGAFWVDKTFNNGRMTGAHRASLYIYRGIKLCSHEHACHTCDNTLCVNPDHLFVGSHTDNMRDMVAKGRHVTMSLKLSESDIVEARLRRVAGESVKEIALSIGMSPSHMSRVLKGCRPKGQRKT